MRDISLHHRFPSYDRSLFVTHFRGFRRTVACQGRRGGRAGSYKLAFEHPPHLAFGFGFARRLFAVSG